VSSLRVARRGTGGAVTDRVWTAAGFTGLRLLRHAEQRGLTRGEVAAWLGVGAREPVAARIPIDRLFGAWASLSRTLGDPAVGVRAAVATRVDDLDFFGYCVATAPTGRAAVDTAARYAALITDSGRWQVDDRADPVVVTWSRGGPPSLGRTISNEAALATFAAGLGELTGAAPLAVELRHRRSGQASNHRDLLGCPVLFGRERDAVLLARRALDVVPRRASAGLWRFLCALADQRVAGVRTRTTRQRVEGALFDALEGDRLPSALSVARSLGMSERTLRRRLVAERVSFRELLDQARRGRAAELLDSEATLTEVALAAGFADVSALGHAWRRWFGVTPSSVRRAARDPA
jgi:AraC-like DNA-binding protein